MDTRPRGLRGYEMVSLMRCGFGLGLGFHGSELALLEARRVLFLLHLHRRVFKERKKENVSLTILVLARARDGSFDDSAWNVK